MLCSKPVLGYVCPACGRAYNTLQAANLIRPDGQFHCEDDDTLLQSGDPGEGRGGESARLERRKAMKALQAGVLVFYNLALGYIECHSCPYFPSGLQWSLAQLDGTSFIVLGLFPDCGSDTAEHVSRFINSTI